MWATLCISVVKQYIINTIILGLKQFLHDDQVTKHDNKKYTGLYNNCSERGSHARGVYPTQDTSRMGTAKVKQEEEADGRRSKKCWRKERASEKESTK